MPTLEQLQSLVDDGANLVNTSGDKIGKIGAIYLDDQTGEPSWVTVKTGLFGTAETFVPLSDSVTIQDGDVCVAYDKDTIKDAPSIEPDAISALRKSPSSIGTTDWSRRAPASIAVPPEPRAASDSEPRPPTPAAVTRVTRTVRIPTAPAPRMTG